MEKSVTISIKKDVWKKLTILKTNRDYENFNDLIEDMIKKFK